MKFYEITFSPTGGTQRAADLLTGALAQEYSSVDLTDSGVDVSAVTFSPEDVAVIAVPSYGGRVPAVAVQRISAMKGGGAQAVVMCVYGNRAYEDTLAELQDAAGQAGFQIIAAVAAVAEHSIARCYASGRPDAQDEQQLQGFASQIREKLAAGNHAQPQIPGNRPYKKAGGSGMVPVPTADCDNCGLCAKKCPVQAIDRNDPRKTDKDMCICCMRCVAICPRSARKISPQMLAAVEEKLKPVCAQRKEGELYI